MYDNDRDGTRALGPTPTPAPSPAQFFHLSTDGDAMTHLQASGEERSQKDDTVRPLSAGSVHYFSLIHTRVSVISLTGSLMVSENSGERSEKQDSTSWISTREK